MTCGGDVFFRIAFSIQQTSRAAQQVFAILPTTPLFFSPCSASILSSSCFFPDPRYLQLHLPLRFYATYSRGGYGVPTTTATHFATQGVSAHRILFPARTGSAHKQLLGTVGRLADSLAQLASETVSEASRGSTEGSSCPESEYTRGRRTAEMLDLFQRRD